MWQSTTARCRQKQHKDNLLQLLLVKSEPSIDRKVSLMRLQKGVFEQAFGCHLAVEQQTTLHS